MPTSSRTLRPAPSRLTRACAGLVLLGFSSLAVQCAGDLDVCAPTQARLGFFSKGDCLVTRASFFQGHEWLTWLGNRDLPEDARFSDAEARVIAEGNRRVDWPQELLVHLNNGVPAYIFALTSFTNRPENQKLHFLLDDRNDTPTAFAEASAELQRLTLATAEAWSSDKVRALTLVGKAEHLIQDSFSEAHSVREPNNPQAPWCVRTVKAYIERADGFDTDDILYHGVDEDDDTQGIGHTTPQDSLYRAGRDCHEPAEQAAVESCLSDTAKRARLASRDHLATVLRIVSALADSDDAQEVVKSELASFSKLHMELCP